MWRWDQGEPFGSSPANEDPDGNSVAFEFPLRFPGQYLDEESNLAQNWFRDYDPGVGRFSRSDLIGLAGGLNTFAYVGADPLSYTDFSGLARVCANQPVGSFNPKELPPYCKPLVVARDVDQDFDEDEEVLQKQFSHFRFSRPSMSVGPDLSAGRPDRVGRSVPVKPEIYVDWFAVYWQVVKTTATYTYQPWIRYRVYCEREGRCGEIDRWNYSQLLCRASWSKTSESIGWGWVEEWKGRFPLPL